MFTTCKQSTSITTRENLRSLAKVTLPRGDKASTIIGSMTTMCGLLQAPMKPVDDLITPPAPLFNAYIDMLASVLILT
jgi:hypothetical protein